MTAEADISLVRLLQLASPALPVGAFSYSQGLEAAVESNIVHDGPSAARWIGDLLEYAIARMEAPLLLRLMAAWRACDYSAVERWNGLFLASRETAELRAETVQMGFSLRQLLRELIAANDKSCNRLDRFEEIAFPTAFAYAAVQWQIGAQPALAAYLWAWLENQVMAAVKAVPLGQTEGQRILFAVGERIVDVAERALALTDDELGSSAPMLGLMSSRHETQYSRLFRS